LSDHPASLAPERLLKECDQRFLRRSGPGGQNRNKVETAVILTHRPTGLVAEANERRSQSENREQALARLRVILALQIRLPVGDKPSTLWQSRLRGGRISVNPSHEDFPALLAEALDAVTSFDGDVHAAAERLGCTPSQLVKFLKNEPKALVLLNAMRSEKGLRPLK
jgi:hypothetical protein